MWGRIIRLNHRIVDWRPFDYITMDTTPEGTSLAKPPAGFATFALEELPDAHCRLSFRVRAHDRGFATRAKLLLFGPLIRKQWQGHYATLGRLIREEMTQAADTIAHAPQINGV